MTKNIAVSTTLRPENKERLKLAALERDVPVDVLIRDMMNFSIKAGFNISKLETRK